VAVGWGGRPAWWMHHMALGGTIGDVHWRTVNNGEPTQSYRETLEYWPPGEYLLSGGIWVNLLGDPTLTAFPVSPPSGFVATVVNGGLELSWDASDMPSVVSYRLEKVIEGGATELVEEDLPASAMNYTISGASAEDVYMLRAKALQEVYAGSFYAYSQGVFASAQQPTVQTGNIELKVEANQPFVLPAAFQEAANGAIAAVSEPPEVGDLRIRDGLWTFTPPAGFTGRVDMPYARSAALRTAVGLLTIVVE